MDGVVEVTSMNKGRVVTGAGGGIGTKTVERFLENGDTVVGLDRSGPSLKLLEGVCGTGQRLSTLTTNVTQTSEVAAFTARMREKHGGSVFEMRGQFTPENSALVLGDSQVETLQLIRSSGADVSLRHAVILAKAAVTLQMPIVLTSSQENHIQGPTAPELQNAASKPIRRACSVSALCMRLFKKFAARLV